MLSYFPKAESNFISLRSNQHPKAESNSGFLKAFYAFRFPKRSTTTCSECTRLDPAQQPQYTRNLPKDNKPKGLGFYRKHFEKTSQLQAEHLSPHLFDSSSCTCSPKFVAKNNARNRTRKIFDFGVRLWVIHIFVFHFEVSEARASETPKKKITTQSGIWATTCTISIPASSRAVIDSLMNSLENSK